MRLFIAINFDQETKEKLLAVQRRLREFGRGNFSRRENLHLTLAFLGEVSQNQIEQVCRAMDATTVSSMDLTFDHVGCFRRNGGDLWWIGLAENQSLISLQSRLSSHLATQGFLLERRRFSPHITLARELKLQDIPNRNKLLGKSFHSNVQAVSLMSSERMGGKLTYREEYRISAQCRNAQSNEGVYYD